MKNLMILLVSTLFLYGCPNGDGPYEMYTSISPDGSCYREFIRSTDSAFMAGDTSKNPFPMKIDSTWKIEFYKRMANDTSRFSKYPSGTVYKENDKEFAFFAIAGKKFASVKDLADSFRYNNSDWDSIVPAIQFTKKFRWFYTYFNFSETYSPINPFKIVPITKYMTSEEVAALYGEDRSLYAGKNGFEIKSMLNDLDDKSEAWLNENIYEETYRIYLKHFAKFKDMPVDSATFAMAKDTIYSIYSKNDSLSLNLFKDDFSKIMDDYFHTTAFTHGISDEVEKNMEKEIVPNILLADMEINYRMSLPGKVIETNAPFLKNDTLSWKVDNDRFYFKAYTMSATSRKPNYWAFVVTFFIIIITIVGFRIKKAERQ